MLKWYYSGYSRLNILSLISPVFLLSMQLLENLKLIYMTSIMFLLYNVFLNNEKYSEDVKKGLRVTVASSSQPPDSFSLDSISFGGR